LREREYEGDYFVAFLLAIIEKDAPCNVKIKTSPPTGTNNEEILK